MVCYGLVHIIVAYLAIQVALGDSGQQADQNGAIQEVGATSFGAVVLWVLAIGLIAYGLWQLMMAAVGFQWVTKKGKRTRRRIGAVVQAVIGISLGLYAARLVTGSGGAAVRQPAAAGVHRQAAVLPAGPDPGRDRRRGRARGRRLRGAQGDQEVVPR